MWHVLQIEPVLIQKPTKAVKIRQEKVLYGIAERDFLSFCIVLPILAIWAQVILLPQPHVGVYHHSSQFLTFMKSISLAHLTTKVDQFSTEYPDGDWGVRRHQ